MISHSCNGCRAAVLQGVYHPILLASWKRYDARWCCDNVNPETFGEAQQYLGIVYAHGGTALGSIEDLPKGQRMFLRPEQLESVFQQVALALAIAEAEIEFEHRDLHLDNILVKRCSTPTLEFVLNGSVLTLSTEGVAACIIDFTLSRISTGNGIVFTDVSKDSDLFDGSNSIQHEVYRLMRSHNKNDWGGFHPFTNVLWLRYLLEKLTQKCEKVNQCSAHFSSWMQSLQNCGSAYEFAVREVISRAS